MTTQHRYLPVSCLPSPAVKLLGPVAEGFPLAKTALPMEVLRSYPQPAVAQERAHNGPRQWLVTFSGRKQRFILEGPRAGAAPTSAFAPTS